MAGSGFSGQKRGGIGGGTTKEFVEWEAARAATAELTAHVAEADPHPQYQTEAEVTTQIATHEGAADPHPQYETGAEVDGKIATHVGLADPHSQYALENRFKTLRVTTGPILAGTTVDVTATWASAFADINYTVTAVVEDDTVGDGLVLLRVESRTAAGVVVRIQNADSVDRTGTLHLIGIAD